MLTTRDDALELQKTASTSGTGWLTARPGERFCIRIPAASTNGAYSVVEIIADPGDSTPLHVHEKEDEYLLVLEGTVRIVVGDQNFEATMGQALEMKRSIPHAWGNASDKPVRLLFTATPGGCEEALIAIAQGGVNDFVALMARLRVTSLGPPILG